jgi:hypothetical protein
VVLAGKACAGEGDEVRPHAWGGLFGDVQQLGGRCALGERRRIAVGRDHGRQAVVAPGGDDQVGQALITPVTPTTSAQVRVTTPIRLCRSSQRSRDDFSWRTVANFKRRMNGA